MNRKILIIEDDSVIQKELKTLLKGHGYEVQAVEDFRQTIETVKQFSPHLILLEVKLPGEDGFSLCAKIRSFSAVPIVFVTSCSTDMDELNSIMLGGDAFITKPYHTAILLAKMDSLLKKAYPREQNTCLTHRGVTLHLEDSTISRGEESVELTKNEVKILYYLFCHAGSICARGDLIEYLWDNRLYVDDNALSVNINRIREKLSCMGVQDFIITKHRQGYRI